MSSSPPKEEPTATAERTQSALASFLEACRPKMGILACKLEGQRCVEKIRTLRHHVKSEYWIKRYGSILRFAP